MSTLGEWTWREWGFGSPEDNARDLAQSRRGALPSSFVAVRDGKPAGIVSLIECNLPPRCELRPWLAGLFVHPAQRGLGVGTALTRFCEREAAQQGFAKLYLYTSRAEGFYLRLGWQTLESMTWDGAPIAVMGRDLPGVP